MAETRAERLVRRTSGRADTEPVVNRNPRGRPRASDAPERNAGPEPRVKHPEDQDGDGDEEASSLHPSRSQGNSTRSRMGPCPSAALLMAQELLR